MGEAMSTVARTWTPELHPSVHVRFDDAYMSSLHARVVQREDDTVWIQDMGSTNGTWIYRRGVALIRIYAEPVRLLPGDRVRMGRTTVPWSVGQ